MKDEMVRTSGLRREYGEVVAVEDMDLSVPRGAVMALACLALAYALPMIILLPTKMTRLLAAFVPYANYGIGAAANLAGPLAQVLIMGYLLRVKIKAVLEERN